MDSDNMFKWVFGILVILIFISTVFNIFLVNALVNKTEVIEVRPEIIQPLIENKTNWRIENNVAVYEEGRCGFKSETNNRSIECITD
jgi:hypothetical protein